MIHIIFHYFVFYIQSLLLFPFADPEIIIRMRTIFVYKVIFLAQFVIIRFCFFVDPTRHDLPCAMPNMQIFIKWMLLFDPLLPRSAPTSYRFFKHSLFFRIISVLHLGQYLSGRAYFVALVINCHNSSPFDFLPTGRLLLLLSEWYSVVIYHFDFVFFKIRLLLLRYGLAI